MILIGLPPTFEEFGRIASGIWGDMGGASTILGLFHLAKVPIPDFKGPCKTLHGCGCSEQCIEIQSVTIKHCIITNNNFSCDDWF